MARRKPKPSKQQRTLQLLIGLLLAGAALWYIVSGEDPLQIFRPKPTPIPIPTPIVALTPEATPAPRELPTPTLVPMADWWQVYFSDPANLPAPDNIVEEVPPESIEEKLIEHIDQAETSIYVAAFEFNLTPVANALIAAHERGVTVQWLTDDEYGIEADEEDEGHGQFAMLEEAGIEIRDDGRSPLMHNKFWVFDSKIVWTGSTNITQNGMFRNNNNVIVLHSPELAVIYEREFQELWNGQYGKRSPSTPDEQRLTIDNTPIQILFAPEDEVIAQLVPLVEQAQNSIRIMAFSFTHDDLGEAVLARAKARVDLMAIFETVGSETEYAELSRLACAGFAARQDGNKGILHHKVLVLDDTVVTGSLNFSDSANEKNDENVLIITHPEIAALYRTEFDRRWSEAREPDLQELGCAVETAASPASSSDNSGQAAECTIKGNIGSGKKYYYLSGDPNYNRVKIDESKGERWFCTEAEAQTAGWTHKE